MPVREEGSCSLTESVAFQAKLARMTTPAVDFAVSSVVNRGRVQMPFTLHTAEAPSVPYPAGSHQLLSIINSVIASSAGVLPGDLLLVLVCLGVEINQRAFVLELSEACSNQCRYTTRPSVAIPMRPIVLAIAESAENVAVRGIAAGRRVQRTLALQAVEARLMEAMAS